MTTQPIMHEMEELGQNRPYTKDEATGLTWLATALGVWGACGGVLLGGGTALFKDWPFLPSVLVGAGVGCFLGSGYVLIKGAWEQLDGLRSWRKATSYVPVMPTPQPEQPRWRPPIPVINKDEVRLLDMNPKPSLPEPEPMLTPQRVLEILQASVENDGSFSRRTITGVKLSDGIKVTRGMWRELSAWLHQVGVLRQDGRGSYCLPHQVRTLDDLFIQLPGLAQLGGPDGQRTGPGTGPAQPARADDGAGGTLADRRRQEWLDCGCDVEVYRRGKS